VADTPDWIEIGRRISEARQAIEGLSARSAAKLAPMSPTYWQDLERGYRLDGGRINPSNKKLADAARVVGLDPAPLFALAGRSYSGPAPAATPSQLERLSVVERRLNALEAKVDLLLSR
jgi:transcriptional regulator with XRE-family HTH domain